MTSQQIDATTFKPPLSNKSSLPPAFLDTFFTRLNAVLPEWLVDPFLGKQRQLLAIERKLQRKFIREYRTQVKSLEPILKERGKLIGRALVDAFLGHHTAQINYTDVQKSPSQPSDPINAMSSTSNGSSFTKVADSSQASLKDILISLDPLLSPVLDPFVEGIKMPINELVGGVESDVKKAFVATAAVFLLSGIVIGRLSASGRGCGGGSDGAKRM